MYIMSGKFISNLDKDEIFDLDLFLTSFIFKVQHMVNDFNIIVDDKGGIIKNFTQLRKYLDISESTWNRHISKYLKEIIKNIKIESESCLILNPKFSIRLDFKLNKYIYENFKNYIIENINLFINHISDLETLDLIKPNINNNLYYIRFMEISPEENYAIIDESYDNSGVYVLYKKSDIIYIGKSKNIKKRIDQHKTDKDFDRVKSIVFKNESYIDIYEPYLINKYKPILNRDLIRREDNFLLPDITLD